MAQIPPPSIQVGVPIADPNSGAGTAYFLDWLTRILTAIIDATNSNTQLIANLQAQQQALIALNQQVLAVSASAAAAQAAADAAGGTGAQSGTANGYASSFSTATWTHGPVVNLTGVIAGTLTMQTTGPNQDNTTGVNAFSNIFGLFTGNWRLVEVISGVDTVVFSGTYSAQRDRDDTGIENNLWNNTDTTNVSIARSTTGTMSYRIDINSPDCDVTNALCNLYVRRA